MSPEKRSAVMSRIKGKDTGIERTVAAGLALHGLVWESHVTDLPGKPDFVFRDERLAVFVDGDFWHGWRFPQWKDKLSEKWEDKIEATRRRDAHNHRRLRRMGWKVIRIWEHQLERSPAESLYRIVSFLQKNAKNSHAL